MANERSVQCVARSFVKETRALKEVDNDRLRAIIESDPLTRHVPWEHKVDQPAVVRHSKQGGRVKNPDE
ncbi:hypothetical protein DICVIV_05607 [Dictyocaulus viviparus]|uniref:Uncharacterized protein n=1 Tax=Dictyocaulus viviparus TaxID=29172 RepID=A0A0D8XUL6_DICVI|nr:hypothetical protein DICVIV_05607 [Dictyocaulus viviparus]